MCFLLEYKTKRDYATRILCDKQKNFYRTDLLRLKMNEIGARIRSARLAKDWTQPELARECGWQTQSRVSNYERGDREPKSSDVRALAKALGVTEAWLWTGHGGENTVYPSDSIVSDLSVGEGDAPPEVNEYTKRPPSPAYKRVERKFSQDDSHRNSELLWAGNVDPWDDSTELGDDEVEVPLFREVELSAGSGRTQVVEDHGPKLRFSIRALRKSRVQPDNAGCAYVTGNSMSPIIPDGSTIGVDKGVTEIHDGDIYAINHDGMLRVKYVYRIPGGGLKFRSYNEEEHPPESYSAEEAENSILVVGRVFWWSVLR